MDFSILVPPAIGAVIGYITNDIAIKMLFHPRKTLYIGKWRVPFTPGLIPKEKDRVARSIGHVVSSQLLNSDTLINVLTSPETKRKMRESLTQIVEDNRNNEDTLDQALIRMAPVEVVDLTVDSVKDKLKTLIYAKLTSSKLGERISSHLLQKVNQSLGGYIRGTGFGLLDDVLISSMAGHIGEAIDKTITDHSQEIVDDLVESEAEKLLQMRVCDIIEKYDSKIPDAIEFIIQTFVNIIENNLERILTGINIGKIVEDKIASFDVVQLEQMIFGIMKKELNAIVKLGALLGFIMGWFNLLLGV